MTRSSTSSRARQEYNEAGPLYARFLKLADDRQILFRYGYILLKDGAYNEAISEFTKFNESGPPIYAIDLDLGIAYYQREDYLRARSWLRQAVPLASDDEKREKAQEILNRVEERVSMMESSAPSSIPTVREKIASAPDPYLLPSAKSLVVILR